MYVPITHSQVLCSCLWMWCELPLHLITHSVNPGWLHSQMVAVRIDSLPDVLGFCTSLFDSKKLYKSFSVSHRILPDSLWQKYLLFWRDEIKQHSLSRLKCIKHHSSQQLNQLVLIFMVYFIIFSYVERTHVDMSLCGGRTKVTVSCECWESNVCPLKE